MFDTLSDTEILAIVNPIMDNLMDASATIDHARHTRDFTDRMKAIVTPEHMDYVCTQYQAEKGFFTEREFVALFRREHSIAVIWKQHFSKAKGDFVAEAVFIEQDSRILVDHAMVF